MKALVVAALALGGCAFGGCAFGAERAGTVCTFDGPPPADVCDGSFDYDEHAWNADEKAWMRAAGESWATTVRAGVGRGACRIVAGTNADGALGSYDAASGAIVLDRVAIAAQSGRALKVSKLRVEREGDLLVDVLAHELGHARGMGEE